jgi:hypothetical protein
LVLRRRKPHEFDENDLGYADCPDFDGLLAIDEAAVTGSGSIR